MGILISSSQNQTWNVEKTSNTFTLPSPHNTSVLEKTTKLLTPHPMTFIHQNKHTMSYAYKIGPDGRCFHAAWAVSKSAH